MKKRMALFFGCVFSSWAMAQTLDTPHFTITITCQTEEYEVGCSSVSYDGISKKTGEEMQLQGKQIMQMCADGVTPCHSLGYEFMNGNIRYFVSESGQLMVNQGDKVILNEAGTWTDQ